MIIHTVVTVDRRRLEALKCAVEATCSSNPPDMAISTGHTLDIAKKFDEFLQLTPEEQKEVW